MLFRFLSRRNRLLFLIVGTGLLLVAGIGKLGWSIQTWDGETSAEKLNDCIFWIASYIGTFFLFTQLNYQFLNKTGSFNTKVDIYDTPQKHLTVKNLLSATAIIVLIVCVCFGLSRNYQPMWVTFFAFGILLFYAYIDKISEFRIDKSGFMAKTREFLKEAKSTIKELQSLSKIMASTTLGLVKKTGRLGGYSYDEKENIKEATLKVLHEIGVSEEEIEEVVIDSKWHEYVEYDYAHHILGGSSIKPADFPQELWPLWKEFREFGLDNIPKPAEITELLDKCGLLSEESKELIKDYEHYIKKRKQRRLEIWKKRWKWNHLNKNENA